MHSTDSNSTNFQNDQVWAKKLVPLPPTNFNGSNAVESAEAVASGERDPFCRESNPASNLIEPPQENAAQNEPTITITTGPVVEIVGQMDMPAGVASPRNEDPFVSFDRALADYSMPVQPAASDETANGSDETTDIVDSAAQLNGPNDAQSDAAVNNDSFPTAPSYEPNSLAADPFVAAAPFDSPSTQPSDPQTNNETPPSAPTSPLEPADMHEFDLAMKVLNHPNDGSPNVPTVDNFNGEANSATDHLVPNPECGTVAPTEINSTNDTMADGTDSNRYLEPTNMSEFVPGVTPIDAYPVCKDFLQNHADSQAAAPTELKTLATAMTSIPVKPAESVESTILAKDDSTEQLGLTETETEFVNAAATPDPLFESVEESIIQLQSINQLDSDTSDSDTNDSVATLASLSLPELDPQTLAADKSAADNFKPAVDALNETESATPASDLSADELPQAAQAPTIEVTGIVDEPNLKIEQPVFESNEIESPATQEAKDDGTFLAEPDQVIQVDGNDGFDFIDLACFDVAHAMFGEGQIFLDDGNGTKFQIEYRNISTAVFANGAEVELA